MNKLLILTVALLLSGCDIPKENVDVVTKGRINSGGIKTITLCENGKLIYIVGVDWGYAGGLTSEIIGECENKK